MVMLVKINPDDVDTDVYCTQRPFFAWLLEQKHLSHDFLTDVRMYLRLGRTLQPDNMDGRCINQYRCTQMAFEDYLHGLTPEAIADKAKFANYNKKYSKNAPTKKRRKRK
jgi:hypothetical protein